MCSCEDADEAKVYERALRKAKRGFQCCECPRRIQHGDWYEDTRGMWEAGWMSIQTCLRCAARREAWARIECMPPFTELAKTIRECLHETHDPKRDLLVYRSALRTARAKLRDEVTVLETTRAERYRLAGIARMAKRRAKREMGAGI
jgi:hypothetical protein